MKIEEKIDKYIGEGDSVPSDKKDPNWRCKNCGESNEAKLDQCYICGSTKGKM